MRIRTALIVLLFVAASACFGQDRPLMPSGAAQLTPEERQIFLDSICPGNTIEDGCSACPPETAFSGPMTETWKLAAVTRGHFLAPSSEDALVTGEGCEPHSSFYGGSYMFTRRGSAWRKIWYTPDEIAAKCRRLGASDGRDRLVCAGGDNHQGFVEEFIFLLDPGREPEHLGGEGTFFSVEDSLGACVADDDGSMQSGRIDRVEFPQITPGQKVPIVITARLGRAVVPSAVLDKCLDSDDVELRIETSEERYFFVFDGEKIVPDPRNPPMKDGTAIAPATSYSVEHQ